MQRDQRSDHLEDDAAPREQGQLCELAPNVWSAHQPLRVYGVDIGTRMTVIRLADGSLFVHSPIRLDDRMHRQLDALGPVRHVVAPNLWHHLYAGAYCAAYPRAHMYGPSRLVAKRSDLRLDRTIDDANQAWATELDQLAIRGVPMFDEVVFHHRVSRTLITSDLLVHIDDGSPWLTRQVFRALGAYRKPGWSAIERRLYTRDRSALRESVAHLLTWDFDRIVLAHGAIIEVRGREVLEQAFGWLDVR